MKGDPIATSPEVILQVPAKVGAILRRQRQLHGRRRAQRRACAFEGVRPLKGKLPRARAFIDRDDTGLPVWMELDADVNGVIDGVIDLTPTYDAEGRLVVERFLGPSVVMEARYAYDCAAGE